MDEGIRIPAGVLWAASHGAGPR